MYKLQCVHIYLACLVKFKLATATYRDFSTQQPIYLFNLLHFSDISKTLSSSVSKQLFFNKTKLNIGKCAFCVAELTIWNQLPIAIKSFKTIDIFRNKKN